MIAIITGVFLLLMCHVVLFKGLVGVIGGQKEDE